MRKLIPAIAAVALLGACTEVEEADPVVEETADAESMTDANGETMEAYLGEWDVTYPDGTTGVTTNNADGTYSAVLPDGSTIDGNWTFGADESCWVPNAEGVEPACYAVGAADETGARVLSMADGTSITVSPVASSDTAE
ncbi:hypothetical protein [Erythrobacter alti]|uniref:hypothetical protein n=1 Tax=Erythrobacter alti TaxID=1896145 RepID=UPI0030F40947